MKRRTAVIAAIAMFLASLASGAAALPGGNTTTARWGCVGVELIDKSYCVSNPLPERLPIPETPPLPA